MADSAVKIPEGGIQLRVLGPLGKVEGEQSKGSAKVQQWSVAEEDRGLDHKEKQEAKDEFREKMAKRLREKADRAAGMGGVREARLATGAAQGATTSVLEFTFGPTTDVNKPVGAGGDRATVPQEPEQPQRLVVMPPHRPSGAMRPLVQNKAWLAQFDGLFGRTDITTETTPLTLKTVAAAREAVGNVKPKSASTDAQHTTAKKLDAPTTLTTSTASTDEALASGLSGVDISKAERPSTEAPKPQTEHPSHAKASPHNPFYRSDMTLAIAAQNIHAYFREAADWFTFWHISTSASMLVELSQKPTSTLSRILCHLRWTAEFLRFGRTGWDLRCLPDDFFEDVLPLVMVSCGKLEKLGEWKGCGVIVIGAWKDAEEVGEMLATVRNVRVRDGRGR